MHKSLGWLVLGVSLLIAACGQPQRGAPVAAASPNESPPATASGSPAGWTTYNEPAWGYAVSMPAGWRLVMAGEPTPQQFRHFSSETVTDVTTLKGLGPNAMMLTIIVSNANSGCPGVQPPVGWTESTVPAVAISIDGYNAVVSGHQAQDLSSWGLQATAAKGKYCYSFGGLTTNHDAQVKWAPLFEQMLTTFRFGTPVAPPF